MSALSNTFLSALRHALGEERHLALVDGLRFPTGLASNRWGQELGPTIHLFDPTAIMITTSNSPAREQDTQSLRR
jgi:hypothetical protein